ncbi:MAG: hypothetical protein DPW18_05095 [Chloroflexi bacterium]|nr:hypothetical protein [Chloroflexota bacterium]MDL1943224.1 hypothetical protein [Chloroflexi bacterium CFX2]
MQTLKQKPGSFWFGVLLIFVIAGIAYLPLVKDLGYLNDDWYLMYDMQVKDPGFFHEIFGIDRPGRALAMIPLFSLFGFNPLWYHLSAFLFRVFGGVFLFWTARMMWGERRNFFALAVGLLFAIYPGFLSMPNAIDYQSHILGLFLAMLSVALTVKSILAAGRTQKILLIAGSILAGWGCLSQMEYFIGVEAFRFAAIMVLMWRAQGEAFRRKAAKTISTSLPFLLVAAGFLAWRLFFFESERRATDVGLQVSQVFTDPLIALWWLNYLVQDFFTVTLAAWNLPVYQLAFPMRLKDMAAAMGWAALAAAALLYGIRRAGAEAGGTESGSTSSTMRETLFVSFLTIAGGLIPVILVNRHVTLPDYSRYTLIASAGAVMLLALLVENISRRGVQRTVMGVLAAIAVLTHYGNTIRYADETRATRNFWWQVAWRAPHIKEGVTLLALYPNSPLAEDYFIWGPANFIYYPEKQSGSPVVIKLPAAVLDGNTVTQVTTNGGVETPLRRGNYLERDFGNVLVMVQSSPNSCVRFINGDAPELNSFDDGRIVMVAPYSKLDSVVTEGGAPDVPERVFGKEPERGWCYYYQQADLARQRGDWDAIPILLDEALEKGYYPNDPIEWIPFMQAYAVQGNVEEIRGMTKLIVLDKYLRLQVCNSMKYLAGNETLSTEVNDFITKKICE